MGKLKAKKKAPRTKYKGDKTRLKEESKVNGDAINIEPFKNQKKYRDFNSNTVAELLAYFSQEKSRRFLKNEIVKSNGDVHRTYERIANDLPTITGWCEKYNYNYEVVINVWKKKSNIERYKGFYEGYRRARRIQQDYLVNNALQGLYNHTFSIFLAKNITKLRDRIEYDITAAPRLVLPDTMNQAIPGELVEEKPLQLPQKHQTGNSTHQAEEVL